MCSCSSCYKNLSCILSRLDVTIMTVCLETKHVHHWMKSYLSLNLKLSCEIMCFHVCLRSSVRMSPVNALRAWRNHGAEVRSDLFGRGRQTRYVHFLLINCCVSRCRSWRPSVYISMYWLKPVHVSFINCVCVFRFGGWRDLQSQWKSGYNPETSLHRRWRSVQQKCFLTVWL